MWIFTQALAAAWYSLAGEPAPRSIMKIFGILILAAGLIFGVYSLKMEVGIDLPARDLGYGISTPAMQVANVDRMAQRQNYMIFSGILSIVGAILCGFAAIAPKTTQWPRASDEGPLPRIESITPSTPTSVSICPNCRHMGAGDDTVCARCEAPLVV
jgi:hypothetical protein